MENLKRQILHGLDYHIFLSTILPYFDVPARNYTVSKLKNYTTSLINEGLQGKRSKTEIPM